MGSFIYIYSAPASKGDILFGPDVTGRNRAKSLGAFGIRVSSFEDLAFHLTNLLRSRYQIDRMVIETHGMAGALQFGPDIVSSASLLSLIGKQYNTMFEADARIFLNGCNIADNKIGQRFLSDMAQLFLSKNGGRVGASDSKGIPFFNNKVYHLWGTTFYVLINRGGTKTRLAAGQELPGPLGQWLVTFPGNTTFFYWFNRNETVTWSDGKTIGGKTGKGTWTIRNGSLRTVWDSGSREVWDLPLFSEIRDATWTGKDGSTLHFHAKKIINSNRLFP